MKKGQNLKYSKPFFNDSLNTNTEHHPKWWLGGLDKDLKNRKAKNVARKSKQKN